MSRILAERHTGARPEFGYCDATVDVGALWYVDDQANLLRRGWQRLRWPPGFESMSRETVFQPGVGLPRRFGKRRPS
jgi:hypothetical protein